MTIAIALAIVIATYATYSFTRKNAENATLDEISGILNNAAFSIQQWTDTQKQSLAFEASSPLLRQVFQDLIALDNGNGPVDANAAQNTFANISPLLPTVIPSYRNNARAENDHNSDVFIISKAGKILASSADGLSGRQMSDESMPSLQHAIETNQATLMHGNALFKAPHQPFDRHILIVTPIYALSDNTVGLLAQVIDMRWLLTKLTNSLSFRTYGEIYAVNDNGMILTANSFLREHPLYDPAANNGQDQKLYAINPASPDGALTRSARAVTRQFSGHNVFGYTGYRGKDVVGVWAWLPALSIGLIVEEDMTGAYAGLYQARTALGLLSATMIILIILLSVFIQNRQARVKTSRRYISEITNNIPGVVFRREKSLGGAPYFTFISRDKIDDVVVYKNKNVAQKMVDQGRLSPEDAQALYPEVNRLVHPDDLDAYAEAVMISAKNLTPLQHLFRLKTDDGRIKWFKDFSTPFKAENGLIIWNGIWLDVSEQQKAESALRNINETLELRVTERTQELAKINADMQNTIFERERAESEALRAKDEALLASRSKSEFLANMSHELRTPLNAIIGFSDLMGHEKSNGMSSENWMDYIKYVSESGEHLLSLINDILDYAKAESGRDQLDEHVFPIEQLIKRALRLCLGRAQPDNIALEAKSIDDLISIKGDEKKLKQVLINLVSNAIKFSPKGSTVEVSSKLLPSGGAEIYIKDNGIGIANDDMDKVFEPFGQANNSLNRGIEGTGLGLPLSRSLVELHGGTLHLESQLGIGTTAVIYLPPNRVVVRTENPSQADTAI